MLDSYDDLASYFVAVLAAYTLVMLLICMVFFLVGLPYALMRLHRPLTKSDCSEELPGISVMKPLTGVDDFLETNLESHFRLEYPKFELLFCVHDDSDPAVPLVRKLMAKYPYVDARLFYGGKPGVPNPLVSNVAPAYEAAKYDLLWMSTSRVYATTAIATDMAIRALDRNCAAVHQMPFTTNANNSLAGCVDKVYFGCYVARTYLTLNAIGVNCFTGMSYLVKKSELEAINGLIYYGRFLAEDFQMSRTLHERGFRHKVCAIPCQQNVAKISIVNYKDRLVRWARLRFTFFPLTVIFIEPFIECTPCAFAAGFGLNYLFGVDFWYYVLGHYAVWITLDYLLLRAVQDGPMLFSFPKFLMSWVIQQFMLFIIYFETILSPYRIEWNHKVYKVGKDGLTTVLFDRSASSKRDRHADVASGYSKSNGITDGIA